jgi:trigger factor
VEIQFEKQENASAVLNITLDQSDYQSDYQARLREYTKKVQMKGFRPGKVPPALVERLYGPALKSEAINTVLNKSIDQYLKDNKIELLGDLITDESKEPEAGDDQNKLNFSFRMAMRPEIQYPNLEKIELKFPEIEVSDTRIDDFIADIRKRHGKMSEAAIVSEGDLIKGNLSAADGSFSTETSFPFSRIREGYSASFLGKKVGETISFPIEEAFEEEQIKYVTGTFRDKDRSFSGMFNLEITGITTTEPAEMNQEFFDKAVGAGQASDEASFREKIREMFSSTYAGESESYFQLAAEKYLFDHSEMVLAEDVVSQVIRKRSEGKMSSAEIDDFIPRYIKSMKSSLIKSKVAEDNNIQITEDDLLDAARKQIAQEFQQMGYGHLGDEFIEKYAFTYLEDKERNNRDRMAEKALSAKIADLFLAKSKIVRNVVSIENFNQLVEELN